MDADVVDLYNLGRKAVKRRLNYEHLDQLSHYGSEDPDDPSEQFRKRYRFTEKTVKSLAKRFRNEIGPKGKQNRALTTEQRICCALRFFATGTFQTEIGDGERVSQSTMHRHIKRVTKVFAAHADDVIKFSVDPEVLQATSEGFYGFRPKLPQVVGIIDGTQIQICAPNEYPDQYVNRDGNFALNCLLCVNHRGAITYLSCRWPGSLHDSRVLQESALQNVLDGYFLGTYYLIADSGYACQTNVLTPYTITDTQEKEWFNECLTGVRCKVECVIGQLKRKFPCLTKKINYQPEVVCDIVKACGFMWNVGIMCGDNKGYDPDEFPIEDEQQLKDEIAATAGGRHVRNVVAKYLWEHKG